MISTGDDLLIFKNICEKAKVLKNVINNKIYPGNIKALNSKEKSNKNHHLGNSFIRL